MGQNKQHPVSVALQVAGAAVVCCPHLDPRRLGLWRAARDRMAAAAAKN
jgi:hypothetical protein